MDGGSESTAEQARRPSGARRRAPGPPRERQVKNPLSLSRVESAIARSAAGFGMAFFAQSIGPMLGQRSVVDATWYAASIGAIALALLGTVVTSILRRGVRTATVAFAAIYVVALVTWPLAVLDPESASRDSPWLYYLMTIATAMATIGLDVRFATVYVIAVPVLYAGIRVTPAGGGLEWLQASLDSIYAIILGGVITIIMTILRNAASAVDRAQQTALERYSHAVRQHATEAERVQVDAIVHDSVLTTLLSAARAYTPEAKSLAAAMAGNAIGHLRDALQGAPDEGGEISARLLAVRIEQSARTMSQPVEVRITGRRWCEVPEQVVEVAHSAAVQAMVNSLQHAGEGTKRWVEVTSLEDEGFRVEVGDRGPGFELSSIPAERLGVRVSIIERMASTGGRADVSSAPGEGTVVSLLWPDPDSAPAPEFDEVARVAAPGGDAS